MPAVPLKIEQLDRVVHTDNSGIEIIRTFYVEPYEAHPTVQKILQGYIQDDGDRYPPANDPYITRCLCTGTRVTFADQEAMAAATTLGYVGPHSQPNQTVTNIRNALTVQKEELLEGAAGAIIHATYRPLISATPEGNVRELDWMEPRISWQMKTVPWPGGLFCKAQGVLPGDLQNVDIPDDVADPIAIAIGDLSIRRMLVANPEWEKMAAFRNKVNRSEFPRVGHAARYEPDVNPGGLPGFAPGTLKYVGADVEYMVDSEAGRWYQVTQNFQWVDHAAQVLVDLNGVESQGLVTWNHVLIHPRTGSKIGWYEIGREGLGGLDLNWNWLGIQIFGGKFHDETDFYPLFGE